MNWHRFEAMVEKKALKGRFTGAIAISDAVSMLRREHAATVRAVKGLPRWKSCGIMTPMPDGVWLHCDDVLALLAKRKGKKA